MTRRRCALGLVAVFALMLSPVLADASPVAPVVNPVSIPADAAGTASTTGAEATELATGADACAATAEVVAVCVGLAAYGGFWLGKEYLGPGLFKLFGFGPSGDNRSVYTAVGPVNANGFQWFTGGGGLQTPPVPGPGVHSINWSMGEVQSQTFTADTGYRCLNADGTLGAWQYAFQNVSIGNGQGISTSGQVCASPSTLQSWGVFLHADGTLLGGWVYDAGKPWSVTYTETCRVGTATATTASTVTGYSPTATGAAPFPTDLALCPSILPGSHIDKIVATGGRDGTPEVVVTVPTFDPAATTAYPGCTSAVDTNHPCLLDLRKNGVSCVDGGAACQGWTTYESQMACYWGSYSVPIKWCEDQWRTSFDGLTVSDPSASASITPGGAGFPGTGTSGDPDVSVPVSVSAHNCMAAIWSWNPVDWVFTPIKCALVWAFVPDTATLQSLMTGIKGNIDGSGVGPWLTTLGTLFAGLGGSSGGCSGPSVEFPLTHTTLHPFAACSTPMSTVAGISYAFTSVAVVVLGGLQLARAVGAGFGFNLGLGSRAKVSET